MGIPNITTKETVGETPDVITEETAGENERENLDYKTIEESLQDNRRKDIKYEKTRLKELEEIMVDWIEFNFTEHKSEEEYLLAREKMINRRRKTSISGRMGYNMDPC